MVYVLVGFPEDSSYFEDNDIGYPSYGSDDNGARYVPEEDYIKVFGHKPDEAMLYKIVQWPESQELMEDEGFEEYSEGVFDEKGLNDFICPAYWVPISKAK
jgi:hypothetical protein